MAKLKPAVVAGGGVEILSDLVAGAAADTDIAVSGWSWAKDPQVIAIIKLGSATYSAPSDLQAEIQRGAASSDNEIQLSTTATTGDQLLIIWAQNA